MGDHSSSSLWGLPVSGVLLFVSGALLAVAHTYVHVHSNPHTYTLCAAFVTPNLFYLERCVKPQVLARPDERRYRSETYI